MNNQFLGKVTSLGTLSLALLAMTGCLGSKNLSQGITDQGRVQQQDIVFPELDTAWQKNGQFPNSENLAKIRPGIAKDDLYQLIGPPHFSEGSNAREWDYILKFYDNNQQVKVCQYKVIFDKEYKGQEFYWSPADCPPKKIAVVQSIPERINLGADTLFEFNKSEAQNMLPQGRRELDELAQKLREYQQMGQVMVSITGHTDRKGDNAYNMNLSSQRAQTVANYLVNQGVSPNSISATGAGELQPVQQCSTALSRQQEIDCLQPNRRVTIDVTVVQ
jgi:outer membrane protein OmpA-like peptidoglycan-associated protein